MAVITYIPGLKVEIIVNGVPLEEFVDSDEENPPNTTTKYVEASSGVPFEVQYSFSPTFNAKHDIALRVFLDGKYSDGHVIYTSEVSHLAPTRIGSARELVGGSYSKRRFRFSQLDIDDDDTLDIEESLKRTLQNVGSISLQVTWVSVINPGYYSDKDIIRDNSSVGTIPEKALKGRAVSHQASLGEREPTSAFKSVSTKDVYGGEPFATYCFKYRSRKALKALCIIPRTPSPIPLEDRDVNELTPDELRELFRRQHERENVSRLVKKEGVKRERSRDRSATATVNDGDAEDGDISFIRAKRLRHPITLNEDGIEVVDLT